MRVHTAEQQSEQQAQREAQRAQRLQKAKLKLSKSRGAFGALHPSGEAPAKGAKQLARSGAHPPGLQEERQGISKEEAEFLLDEWESEGEDCGSKRKANGYASMFLVPCTVGLHAGSREQLTRSDKYDHAGQATAAAMRMGRTQRKMRRQRGGRSTSAAGHIRS